MGPRDLSRRDALKAGIGALSVGAMGGLSGCSSVLDGDESTGTMDDTPQNADFALLTDVRALLDDDALRSEINARLEVLGQRSEGAPTSVEDVLDDIQSDAGLDPRELNRVLQFGRSPNAPGASDGTPDGTPVPENAAGYTGFVLYTGWEEEAFVSALTESTGTEPTETTYEGQTVYESPEDAGGAFAPLGDGTFVFGTNRATRDVIDLREGNAEPASGQLREAFAASRDGYVRFASDVRDAAIPEDQVQFGAALAQSVEYAYGSVYADGDQRGLRFAVEAESEADATDIGDTVRGAIAYGETDGNQTTPRARPYGSLLENTTVSVDGTTVTVTTEMGVEAFTEGIARVFTALFGFGAGPMGSGGPTGV